MDSELEVSGLNILLAENQHLRTALAAAEARIKSAEEQKPYRWMYEMPGFEVRYCEHHWTQGSCHLHKETPLYLAAGAKHE